MFRAWCSRFILALPVAAAPVLAVDVVNHDRSIPNEYETVGGHSLGLANGGVAAAGGLSAVRLNPGMLAMEKEYAVGGGYNWPTQGREYYQAGVIDTKSSSIAAGFLYSGFQEDFNEDPLANAQKKDAQIVRRATLALGQTMDKISLGMNGQYVEGYKAEDGDGEAVYNRVRGTALGFGLAGLITPALRFGISAENMANRKIAEYAPRTFRGGVAYLFGEGNFTAHFDLRQRDRINSQEISEGTSQLFAADSSEERALKAEDKKYKEPERMAIVSASAKVYDMLRLLGGYGQSIVGPDRKTLAGGVALVGEKMSISYTAARPYMDSEVAQQAVNLSLAISL